MKVFKNLDMILVFAYILWPLWIIAGVGAYVAYSGFRDGAILMPCLLSALLIYFVYLIAGHSKEVKNASIH